MACLASWGAAAAGWAAPPAPAGAAGVPPAAPVLPTPAMLVGPYAVAAAGGVEEFFIVSSLDPAHGRIVLKRPTEVTVTMRVDAQTSYRDEQGKALGLANLRAGATVYIVYRQEADGGATARLVRLGPMTVQVLRDRYLAAAPVR